MIKDWAIRFFLLFSRKTNNFRRWQPTAERLTRNYLDSVNSPDKYDILQFSDFHPVMIKEDNSRIKPQLQGWVITVVYNGRNENGIIGKHKCLVAFNSELSKVMTAIETTSVNIHI